MISASLSISAYVHMRPFAQAYACLYVCVFVYVFHYVVWWLCLVMLFSRADCFELLDAFSCGLCLCVSNCVCVCVCFHAHTHACTLVSVCVCVLWYYAVFDVLVQVRFGRFFFRVLEN